MAADILEKILAVKREEVAAGKAIKPLAAMRAEAEAQALRRESLRDRFKQKSALAVRQSSPKSRRPAPPKA
jgi:hypothetical protein